MRAFLLLSAAAGLLLGQPQPVRAQDELKAIIVKAVQAHGGEEKLTALESKAIEMKSKGTIHLLGGFNYTSEVHAQLPGKFREVTQMEINGIQITQTVVLNGEQCWINVNGMNIGDQIPGLDKEIKASMYERRVMSLLPLLKGKEFELGPLGEVKVGDEDAVGVKVSSKGQRDVSLYFSKKTGLLVKTEGRAVDFMTMQEVAQEFVLSDYEDKDGFKTPRKLLINRDGKKFLDKETTEFRVVDKIDESVFAKP